MIGTSDRRCVWCDERITNHDHYCPSPHEIRMACSAIRKTWTEEEERKRRLKIQDAWTLPTLTS
jgi:hypothetical protein